MKLNFLINNDYIKHGVNYRYADFLSFLQDNNIEYDVNNTNTLDYKYNIIDINYICNNIDFKLTPNCYIFCGSSRKVITVNKYFSHHRLELDYSKFMTHNLCYAKALKCFFFPMFLHKIETNIEKTYKYKYGMFITDYDVNYLLIDKILNIMNIDKKDILFMDRENYFNNQYNKTRDKNYFYSNVETFLEFANDYSNRHVMSRTYLELIYYNIPINIISFNNSIPTSFKGFSHIKYDIITEYNDFKILNALYNPVYFKTDTYSEYIKNILNNLDNNVQYESVEEYANK